MAKNADYGLSGQAQACCGRIRTGNQHESCAGFAHAPTAMAFKWSAHGGAAAARFLDQRALMSEPECVHAEASAEGLESRCPYCGIEMVSMPIHTTAEHARPHLL